MRIITLPAPDDFDAWRDAARGLIADSVPPDQVVWQVGDQPADLFGAAAADVPTIATPRFNVSRAFIDLARSVILSNDPERFALLHTALDRLRHQPRLIEDQADPLIRRLDRLTRAVRRDIHKMRAFRRFRETEDAEGPH